MLQNASHFSARVFTIPDGRAFVEVTAFFGKPNTSAVLYQVQNNPDGKPQLSFQYACPTGGVARATPFTTIYEVAGYTGGHVWVNDKLVNDLPTDDFTVNGCPAMFR